MEEFNVAVFLLINKYAGSHAWMDLLCVILAEGSPYLFILLSVYLWFRGDSAGRRAGYLAAISTLFSMCLSYIISLFYTHHRPFVEGLGTQLVNHAPDTSFPSDHTTFIFAVFTAILFTVPGKFLKGALFSLALLGGVSRVFTGVHFPFDIVSGMLVGGLSSLILIHAWPLHQPAFNFCEGIFSRLMHTVVSKRTRIVENSEG